MNQQRPRMVKRRNSPYASFKRPRTKAACDFTSAMSQPSGSKINKPQRATKNEFMGY